MRVLVSLAACFASVGATLTGLSPSPEVTVE
jgi:hypothetical protein